MNKSVVMVMLIGWLCVLAYPNLSFAALAPLKTAWIGEHEAFPLWYAKQKGWDKEVNLNVSMLKFGSGDKLLSRQDGYGWVIAGSGALPVLLSGLMDQLYVIGVANDESAATALYVRADSPILGVKGNNPEFPEVYGNADLVRDKLILYPTKTSGQYLVHSWLKVLGLGADAVKTQNVLPEPAVDMFMKGFGDVVALWAPSSYVAEAKGLRQVTSAKDSGVTLPMLILVNRVFAEENPVQVKEFLNIYIRAIDEMRQQGVDAFVDSYVKFAKEWLKIPLTPEQAKQDLTNHPVFDRVEQITMLKSGGQVFTALQKTIAACIDLGLLPPESNTKLQELDFINTSFLRAR